MNINLDLEKVLMLLCIFFCCTFVFSVEQQSNVNNTRDSIYLFELENIISIRELITKRNPSIIKEYNNRIKKAEALIDIVPFSVIQKTSIPTSGDKRDYLSLGPYWWPDPSKPHGLPWIRKDGEINPKTRDTNTDIETKNKFFKTFKIMAWAAIFSEENRFINKAEELIRTWFTDSTTAMNPNLNYAQGIPGLYDGRGFGIIEFAGFSDILMYIELMDYFEFLNKKVVYGFTKWVEAYSAWLQNSELGKFERARENNHGTWYDVQLVSILLYLNKTEEAKEILEKVKTNRIASQIDPDGSQPHELKRTKALSYATMNLKAFTKLAYFGKKIGVDLLSYTGQNGGSIPKAYNFLIPYAKNEKSWDYEQIKDLKKAKESLRLLIKTTGCKFSIPEYEEVSVKMSNIDRILNSCDYGQK